MIDISSNEWNALVLIGTAQRLLRKVFVSEEQLPKLSEINAHLCDAYLLLADLQKGEGDETTSEPCESDS